MKFIFLVLINCLAAQAHNQNETNDCNVYRVEAEHNRCLCDLETHDWVENTCLKKCGGNTERVGTECLLKCPDYTDRYAKECRKNCPEGLFRVDDGSCQKPAQTKTCQD